MKDILYALVISVLVIILLVVSSFFAHYYYLVDLCYGQPSPYCRADTVCPTSDISTPTWMACNAQSAVQGCTTCTGDDCPQLTNGTCPDPWCLTCALQSSTTSSCSSSEPCTRFDNSQPTCPSSSGGCVINNPS